MNKKESAAVKAAVSTQSVERACASERSLHRCLPDQLVGMLVLLEPSTLEN